MELKKFEAQFGSEKLIFETGKLANLADGSVTVTWGETVILATVVVGKEPREGVDFFPLLVDYEERLYAAGKISGSRFIKREGRPTENAILSARLIDRPLRPLFPKDFRNDVQVIITILSYDGIHNPETIAIVAASAALSQTQAPFEQPVGAARIGRIDNEFVLNPTEDQIEKSTLDLVIAGTKDRIIMIESGAHEIPEDVMLEAMKFGHAGMQPVIEIQNKIGEGVTKIEVMAEANPILDEVKKLVGSKIPSAVEHQDKLKRESQLDELRHLVLTTFEGVYKQNELKNIFEKLVEKEVRDLVIKKELRPDGRKITEIRPISIEIDLLPRTHGSGLFNRGQTQALTIATLGSPGDEQMIDTLEEEGTKRYMHHYNFPPFSVGEVKPMRGASRRDIGHGALAERALIPVIPNREDFPYTIRLVSEILGSNGSSSMAATCGSTLALMAAGVPIRKPVAGIAIGLMTSKDKPYEEYQILTDIQGIEDFAGDMDFKVTGTDEGITAIQMDTKIKGLSFDMIQEALERAKNARLEILEKIKAVIPTPRSELSDFAPRIYTLKVAVESIGELIGPGGKNIRKMIEDAGGKEVVSIDIEDDGTVLVSSADKNAADKAIAQIKDIGREFTIGEILTGTVEEIIKDRMRGNEVGAIINLGGSHSGMVHISEVAPERINKVSDKLKIGDKVTVKVVSIDKERGRMGLSIKQNGLTVNK
jgi:polyribonucleotide nucleotidyltransferase